VGSCLTLIHPVELGVAAEGKAIDAFII